MADFRQPEVSKFGRIWIAGGAQSSANLFFQAAAIDQIAKLIHRDERRPAEFDALEVASVDEFVNRRTPDPEQLRRLGKLPDRTPVKLTVLFSPQLHADLARYAAAYREAYGQEEAVADLVPAMLAAFLDADREFQRLRTARTSAGVK